MDLERIMVAGLAEFDREITEFRDDYVKLTAARKRELQVWLESLGRLVDQSPAELSFTLLCRIDHLDTAEDGNIERDGVVHLHPKAMLAAMRAWDAGRDFTPASLPEVA
jgi:hypothetical protein